MIEIKNACYLCGEKKLAGFKGFSWLVECRNCGLVYNPALSIDSREVSHRFYGDVNVEHRRKIQSVLLRIARIRWQWLKKRLPVFTGHLLEIGCGTGEFLKTAMASGWDVSGLELSENFRDAAKDWYGLDLQGDELAQAGFADNSFDMVTLLHVFEHLPNPLEFINQISRIVKSGGWLFIAVPSLSSWTDSLFGNSNPTLTKMDHFFHYTPSTLQRVFFRSSFDIVEVVTHEPSHHIWSCLYGFLASKKGTSSNLPAVVEKRPVAMLVSKIKSNTPYWIGTLSSIFLYPLRFWLQKTNRGHEIYLLCRKK
jgi:SAM-dependent methyltransferase